MDTQILNYLNSWGNWLYLLVFAGMLLEGNATMFIVGFLLSAGHLHPFGLVLSAFGGALTEQLFWFWFGVRLKNSNSRIADWVIEKSNHFDEHFIHRPRFTLLVSKFIYGVHRAAIARAGVVGIGVKNYIKHIIPVLLAWMLIVGGIGFVVKQSFSLVEDYLRYAELALLGVLILIILIQRFVISGKLKEIWKRI